MGHSIQIRNRASCTLILVSRQDQASLWSDADTSHQRSRERLASSLRPVPCRRHGPSLRSR